MQPMSESDQTWNAAGDEPPATNPPPETPEIATPPASTPAAGAHVWPQYSWSEPDPAATVPSTPATPTAPAPTVSWPPTSGQSAAIRPQPTIEFTPLGAPGPYATGASQVPAAGASGSGAGWGPPPGWAAPTPGWPPAAPAPAPGPAPASGMRKRVLAIVAAAALVLTSAGIGAGIAVAVHDGSKATPFSAGLVQPNTGTNPNGSANNGSPSSGSGSIDVAAIAAKVDPAIVNINTTLANGRAAGTGMLISSTGEILTNNHVIADATSIKVVIGGKGDSHDAKVVGYDVSHDVALLQITDSVKDLPTIVFGDPSKVKVSDPVVAIGNAGGVGGTPSATSGQVTALDQQVTASDGQGNQETLEGMIQIDAPIQPGDSGGALINSDAKIIGMNTAAAGGGRFSFNTPSGSNVGFAIPIDNAVHIVSQIRSGNETETVFIGDRGLLGVQIEDISSQPAPVSSGALVVGVQNGSGADDQGIQSGDVITEANGKPVTDSASLRGALSRFHAGDSVDVVWVDTAGSRHEATVKLVPGPPL
jgi:S1-C subfamily serine protease